MLHKLTGTVNRYCVELYDSDDVQIEDWCFGTKAEQLAKYYGLSFSSFWMRPGWMYA
jgi:hypothetical protein